MTKKLILSLAAMSAAFNFVFAKIEMPKIFSDNMVLQSGKPVKFWGKAAPKAEVEVVMENVSQKTSADSDGNWSLYLKPLMASKIEKSLHVFENGHIQKSINGVLVGEVWICSGQSNMEWPVAKTTTFEAAKKFAATNPKINYFAQASTPVEKDPQFDNPAGSKWLKCTPETVANFSAIGFYFAEDIYNKLGVPVGLIYAARGATAMCCWIPKEDMPKEIGFAQELARFNIKMSTYDYKKELAAYEKRMKDFAEAKAKAKAEGKPEPKLTWVQTLRPTEMGIKTYSSPYGNYNKMLHPIKGYSVQGILWYQGESDAGLPRAAFHKNSLEFFINNWRRIWDDDNLAFYMVQLSSFTSASEWPRIQNDEFEMSKKMKNVKTAPCIDYGEEKDIHPKEKAIPAKRLAQMALKNIYGFKCINAEIPFVKNAQICGGEAVLNFETYGNKIECRGQPRGFEIKCFGQWIAPKAEFKDEKIVLSSPDGQDIQAVRYLWKGWSKPDICLYSNGIPLPNFNSELNN